MEANLSNWLMTEEDLKNTITFPGSTIVHEHPVRHSIESKDGCQVLNNSLMGLIGACSQTQQEAGTVIQNCEGMTASTTCQRLGLVCGVDETGPSALPSPVAGIYPATYRLFCDLCQSVGTIRSY